MPQISSEQKAFFEQEGYLIVKGLFSQQEIDEIKEEYRKLWLEMVAEGEIAQDKARPVESLYPRLSNHHRVNDVAARYMLDERTRGVVEQLIGEEALVIQTVYYFKAPGGRGLPLHQDNYDIGVTPGTTYTAWVSLEHSTKENGGLFLVPGSHRFELAVPVPIEGDEYHFPHTISIPDGYKTISLETEPGDVVYFTGNTYHGSHKNQTRHSFRQSFVTHYAASSVERITLNHNMLVNSKGERVRRRLNPTPKAVATQGDITTWRKIYFPEKGKIH
ncbi:phytanoyl-CoA dioxygenase family protein [Brevibacillus humidisoli]|uniref:phytanoyl-CoA dioxygenase family protein n=1 Tax=Brevibacillus humidisoli TaxID=2895522 RepID=UPI001E52BC7B|nr:phytanoyl-CoA dioxygenase family protein [Brevibacillus humidisoli]UFJ42453.1 phytanoyl-CoA dioxygenase family protein [Brevibacillus humidisoli]